MKFPYFLGAAMGLAIASTSFLGASAQGCFLNKSAGQGLGENKAPNTYISDVSHPHTHDGVNPLAVAAGLAGIGGIGAAGLMMKGKAAAQANAEVAETAEFDYEVETVVTDVTAEVDTETEAGDRPLNVG